MNESFFRREKVLYGKHAKYDFYIIKKKKKIKLKILQEY